MSSPAPTTYREAVREAIRTAMRAILLCVALQSWSMVARSM